MLASWAQYERGPSCFQRFDAVVAAAEGWSEHSLLFTVKLQTLNKEKPSLPEDHSHSDCCAIKREPGSLLPKIKEISETSDVGMFPSSQTSGDRQTPTVCWWLLLLTLCGLSAVM